MADQQAGDNQLPLPVVANAATSPMVTPSASTDTVVQAVADLHVSSRSGSPNSGKRKRALSKNDTAPSSKKNRDYLPKEAKPIYLALKNNYKKMAQWEAYQHFTENCVSTGNVPRSLKWTPPIPWAFSNPDLSTQWSKITIKAQVDLCNMVARDCIIKIWRLDETVHSLLQDMAGVIANAEYQELTGELTQSYHAAVDT